MALNLSSGLEEPLNGSRFTLNSRFSVDNRFNIMSRFQLKPVVQNEAQQLIDAEGGVNDFKLPPWNLTNGTLYEHLQSSSILFLNWMGFYGHEDANDFKLVFFKCWSAMLVISFLYFFVYEWYLFVLFCVAISRGKSALYILTRCVSYVAVLIQMCVLIPNMFGLGHRLVLKAPELDLPIYEKYVGFASVFLACCLLFSVSFPIAGLSEGYNYVKQLTEGENTNYRLYYSATFLGMSSSSFYLAASLWFTLVDIRVSTSIIETLSELADKQTLNFQVFVAAREEIKRRKQDSSFLDSLVVVAIINVFGFIVRIFDASGPISWLAAVDYNMKVSLNTHSFP